jgi:hypothetical protein
MDSPVNDYEFESPTVDQAPRNLFNSAKGRSHHVRTSESKIAPIERAISKLSSIERVNEEEEFDTFGKLVSAQPMKLPLSQILILKGLTKLKNSISFASKCENSLGKCHCHKY